MAQWYYLSGGQTAGPVDDAQLRHWVADGLLGPESQVLRAGTEQWVEVRTVSWELGLPSDWAPPPPPRRLPQAPWGASADVKRGPGGLALAAWWRRILAYLLDGLIVGLPLSLVTGLFLPPAIEVLPDNSFELDVRALVAQLVISLVAGCLYWGLLDGHRQTVGKMVLKIRVVDATSGRSVGRVRAGSRYALIQLFFLAFLIPGVLDVLWPLWDPRSQSLHDKVVRSVVIDAT